MQHVQYDAIVVGGGVNGLTCAGMLARGGVRTLVLEQRATLGGCAAEHELAPGFRVPTLAHRTGPLRADVVEALRLTDHGLAFVKRPYRCTALAPDGRALALATDTRHAVEAIRGWSPRDAEAWPGFVTSLGHVANVIASLFARTPPDIDAPAVDDVWTAMRTLGAFRRLPTDEQWRLLRWGPMAVADLVSETFETELLRATVAADGLLGSMFGPWSAGSGLQLLLHEANQHLAAVPDTEVVGGPAAVVRALERATRRHGVELRVDAPVARVLVERDRAAGVVLQSGEVVRARAVVSGLDPKRTFLMLCEAEHLPPEFLWRISHLRARGTLAKVHLAVSARPAFGQALPSMLGGLVRIAPDLDYLERAFDAAKYGRTSESPWVEFTLPSLLDPSLAPDGAHVLSAYVQYVGTPRPDDATLIETTLRTLEQYAPGIRPLVVAAEAVSPATMEAEWGLSGGHIFHGELSLDQAFTMRPLLGWGRYDTPIPGLFLCGSGTHPGTGLTGGSGANAARVVAAAVNR